MADLGMFGSPIGEVRYEDMLQSRAAAQASLATAATAPAHARLYNAQAGKLEEEAGQERMMGTLARQAGGRTPVEQLESLAELAMGAGMVTKGTELAKTASLVRAREARALAAGATTDKTNLEIVRAEAEMVGRAFADVKDQAGFDAANAFYERSTGMPSPFRGQFYSKPGVEQIRNQALSVQQQVEAAGKGVDRTDREAYRKRRLEQLDTENRLRELRANIARDAERRRAKSGSGKEVSAPNRAEMTQAEILITKDWPNLPADELEESTFSVAAEARRLRRANPALSADEALRRAYLKAREAGDFEQVSSGVLGRFKKDKYSGGGRTAATPLPMPTDSKRLTKDRWYQSPNGLVGKWNGTGFEIGRPLSPGNGRTNAEDDDDEDE